MILDLVWLSWLAYALFSCVYTTPSSSISGLWSLFIVETYSKIEAGPVHAKPLIMSAVSVSRHPNLSSHWQIVFRGSLHVECGLSDTYCIRV
jgi:hypothetical protein